MVIFPMGWSISIEMKWDKCCDFPVLTMSNVLHSDHSDLVLKAGGYRAVFIMFSYQPMILTVHPAGELIEGSSDNWSCIHDSYMMTFYNPPTRFFSKNTIKLCKGVSIAGSQPTKGYMFFGLIEKYVLPYHCLVSIQHRVATRSHREVIACYSPWVGTSVKFQSFFSPKTVPSQRLPGLAAGYDLAATMLSCFSSGALEGPEGRQLAEEMMRWPCAPQTLEERQLLDAEMR